MASWPAGNSAARNQLYSSFPKWLGFFAAFSRPARQALADLAFGQLAPAQHLEARDVRGVRHGEEC